MLRDFQFCLFVVPTGRERRHNISCYAIVIDCNFSHFGKLGFLYDEVHPFSYVYIEILEMLYMKKANNIICYNLYRRINNARETFE